MTTSFLKIEERPGPRSGFALWQLGFRPFYLLASVFAALSIGLWALQFAGVLAQPYLRGPIWHAHEMLFGRRRRARRSPRWPRCGSPAACSC
jgi:uncharacterized protein involved in response to NO